MKVKPGIASWPFLVNCIFLTEWCVLKLNGFYNVAALWNLRLMLYFIWYWPAGNGEVICWRRIMALSCVAVDQWDAVTLRKWLLVKPVPLRYCPFYIWMAVYRICGHILVKTVHHGSSFCSHISLTLHVSWYFKCKRNWTDPVYCLFIVFIIVFALIVHNSPVLFLKKKKDCFLSLKCTLPSKSMESERF